MPVSRLHTLATPPIDLLVIGGGIIGAGVARDATLRGFSTVLVEQGDFAGGTSSKTSKLIHGGLRYLEQGRFRLVFEASHERRLLTRLVPHLVTPQTFLTPIFRGDRRGRLMIHAGLSLYDCLALFQNVQRHQCAGPSRVIALEPVLTREALRGGALFGDCQMRDARLVLENVLDASARGARCLNYVTVRELLQNGQRVSGAVLEDVETGERATVQARYVVNATGPWSDAIRRLSHPACPPRLRPSRGIHLVVRSLGLRHLLLISVPQDGRVVFVLPWENQTLLGTTDAPHVDGQPVQATADEVAYLLREVNRVVSNASLTSSDIVATFAGLRPLVAAEGSLSSISREHVLEEDAHGLISLLGGKFTTYRALAKLVVDRVCRRAAVLTRCRTDALPLYGGLVPDVELFVQEAAAAAMQRGLSHLSATHLVQTYGVQSRVMFDWIAHDSTLMPTLCPHHAHIAAEVRYAFEVEHAVTLRDFLFRRTWMAWSPCHGRDALPRIETVARKYLPSLAQRFDQELSAYEAELAAMTAFQR